MLSGLRARFESTPSTTLLRYSLLAIATMGALGLLVELAGARHWRVPVQLVPWVAILVLLVAILLVAIRPSRSRVLTGRVLGVLVLVASAFGVYQHARVNYLAGASDGRYAWEMLSFADRLWLALSQSVGFTPTFAAGALGYAALAFLLATLRHPALGASEDVREMQQDPA